MIDAINHLAWVVEESNHGIDWAAVISAVCSVISLVAIAILLKERSEKKRPYLQVSFELLRSSMVCIVIRNVGEVPAKFQQLLFNREFTNQLPPQAQNHAQDRMGLNITIHPKQQWVLSLDVITPEVLKYQNTKLEVTFTYTSSKSRKSYTETETIEFNDYSGFLVYISEIDELREMIKKLNNSVKLMGKALNDLSKKPPPMQI